MNQDRPVLLNPSRDPLWLTALGVLTLACGILCLRVVYDPLLFGRLLENREITSAVGRISRTEGAVRVRSQENILWYDLPSGNPEYEISDGDTVFTGAGSWADVLLLDGSLLKIQPSSLIVVRSGTRGPSGGSWFSSILKPLLGIASGAPSSVLLKLGSATLNLARKGTVEIQTVTRAFELLGDAVGPSAVQLELDAANPDSPRVNVTSAPSQIQFQEIQGLTTTAPVPLVHGQGVVLPAGAAPVAQPHRIMYRAISPLDGEVLHNPNVGERINATFAWEWLAEPKLGDLANLEVEGPEKFRVSLSKSERHKRLELSTGSYRWRLSYKQDGAETEAPWNSFTVGSLNAPRIQGPANDYRVQAIGGEKASVRLSWEPADPDVSVEVEILREGAKDRSLLKGGPTGIDLSLPTGEYLWKIREIGPKNRKGADWSPSRRFWVSEDAPRVTEAVASVLKPAPVRVIPDPVPVATHVPVRPAPAARPTASPVARPKASQPPIAASSRLELIRVQASLVAHASGTPTLTTSLSWKPVEGAKFYSVRLLKEDGSAIATFQTRDTHYDTKAVPIQNLPVFYVVETLTAQGPGPASPKTELSVKTQAPQLKEPAPQASVRAGDRIIMTWGRTLWAEGYRLQIATDPSFVNVVLDETVSQNLKFFSNQAPGVFYWRVRSAGKDIESDWSARSSFSVK